jgi:2-dehydro-3-deoxy-D-arabinonate dehydratase
MHLVRFRATTGELRVGVEQAGQLHALEVGTTIGGLLRLRLDELRQHLEQAAADMPTVEVAERLPPVDGLMEVWGAGVTYETSREARVEESETAADVYRQVYDAQRPEVFFKAAAWRVVGDGEVIALRVDSTLDVPEPELALIVNAWGEVVGYSVCDDVSSRSIEGENPLYLPQAKIYLGSCAVGPAIRVAWEVVDPESLRIEMSIERAGAVVWAGETNTKLLHRKLGELVDYLFRAEAFPDGVVLSTGTSLVPGDGFTLEPGDTVRIRIDEVGVLTTAVVRGKDEMSWLVERVAP